MVFLITPKKIHCFLWYLQGSGLWLLSAMMCFFFRGLNTLGRLTNMEHVKPWRWMLADHLPFSKWVMAVGEPAVESSGVCLFVVSEYNFEAGDFFMFFFQLRAENERRENPHEKLNEFVPLSNITNLHKEVSSSKHQFSGDMSVFQAGNKYTIPNRNTFCWPLLSEVEWNFREFHFGKKTDAVQFESARVSYQTRCLRVFWCYFFQAWMGPVFFLLLFKALIVTSQDHPNLPQMQEASVDPHPPCTSFAAAGCEGQRTRHQ